MKTLKEFVDRLNAVTDPSRSEHDQKLRDEFGLEKLDPDVDHWNSYAPKITTKKSIRRGDNQPFQDVALYTKFNEENDLSETLGELKELKATDSKVLKASDVSFKYIKSLIGNDLKEFIWKVDNGGAIKARAKITKAGGLVKTSYLHVTIIKPNGSWEYYKETKDGNYTRVSYGK